MRNLFIIAARGGSKGIPKKNIAKIGEYHLIGYKAISALKSNYCDEIIISTDSLEIAEIAKSYGIKVPFIRPDYLARDDSPSSDVIIHAMEWAERHCNLPYDTITLLEPSSPFATYRHINEAFELFIRNDADTVLGVKESVNSIFIAPIEDDFAMKNQYEKLAGIKHLRRQDFCKEYTPNGAVYISGWDYFKENKSFYGKKTYAYIMPREHSVEIDDTEDLEYARFLVEKNTINISDWDMK